MVVIIIYIPETQENAAGVNNKQLQHLQVFIQQHLDITYTQAILVVVYGKVEQIILQEAIIHQWTVSTFIPEILVVACGGKANLQIQQHLHYLLHIP